MHRPCLVFLHDSQILLVPKVRRKLLLYPFCNFGINVVKFATVYEFDIAIIGAGVIGLSIADCLAEKGRKVLVLEKNDTFGQETSTRNSGVVHAGFYYPDSSLKAKLCVEGNAGLKEMCRQYSIPFKTPGKLVIARDDSEFDQINTLWKQGQKNGVPGLKLLSSSELKRLEPNVEGKAALFSGTTGIIDAYALMRFLLQRARDNEAIIVFKSEVVGIQLVSNEYLITLRDQSGRTTVNSRAVINAAGLKADSVAEMVGIDPNASGYRIHYCKGEYFSLSSACRGLVTRLVYPVPEHQNIGLGIHITPDLDGNIRLGPNSTYVDCIDYKVDESIKMYFYESARNLVPKIQFDDLQPDFAGIRPKLQGPGDTFKDFIIHHEGDRGLPGFVNLIGIESPGLTASPAIGKYVKDLITSYL